MFLLCTTKASSDSGAVNVQKKKKAVEDYFETTQLKLFQNFTGSVSKKTFVTNTSRQNLPSWFENDDFHCCHSGEVVETCFLPS